MEKISLHVEITWSDGGTTLVGNEFALHAALRAHRGRLMRELSQV